MFGVSFFQHLHLSFGHSRKNKTRYKIDKARKLNISMYVIRVKVVLAYISLKTSILSFY